MKDLVAVEKSDRDIRIEEDDCHELCVTDTIIEFYDSEEYFDGSDDPVVIATLTGTMVNVAAMDQDPYMVCDDIDQDLGYVMKHAEGYTDQSLFYIEQLDCEDEEVAAHIIRHLPNVMFKIMGRKPDLFVAYPACLPYEQDEETLEHQEMLRKIMASRMNHFYNDILSKNGGEVPETEEDEMPDYTLTQDDIDYLMGSGGGYPESAKNQKEFAFWESLGFKEIDDTRLLILKGKKRGQRRMI